MLTLILSITILMSIVPFEAQASGGSYTLKWYAADPSLNNAPYLPTYIKLTPASLAPPGPEGRYADPLANAVAYGPTSSNLDAVTSLAPRDMALGQVVPYEMVITVSGSTAPENGTIQFITTFNTNTTSGGDFGFDPAYMIYSAFVDTADAGTTDPLNNAKVDNFTSTIIGSGSSQQIQGTFNVSGLENGDRVVVEIWVVLKSTVPTGTSGNVQTGVSSAKTATGDTISTGAQTVPLLQVGRFYTSNADVSVEKADSPDPVIQGQILNYSIVVKNNSPDTVANGIVVNDTLPSNTTFVSASGASYIINGQNLSFNVCALSPGQSTIITIVTDVSRTAGTNNDTSTNSEAGTAGPEPEIYDLLNIVSGTAITGDSNTANNIYYQPTNVLLAHPFALFDKVVTDVAGKGPSGNVTATGDIITYQINVTNTGNIDLTNVTLNDTLINLTGPAGDNAPEGILNVGETWIYTGNYTVTQDDIDSNGGGDGLINNTATLDCDQLAPKSDSAEVPVHTTPAYIISKIITDVAGKGPEGNVTAANDVISYRINVSNVGNVDLTNVTLNDSLINLTGYSESLSTNGILNVGEIWTYTGDYTVTQEDMDNAVGGDGVINNTATVDCDQLDPKSDSAEAPVEGLTAYIINKIVTDVAGQGPSGYATAAGDVIRYQINVTNTGNIDLTNVTLNDSLIDLAGYSESLSTDDILNPGETWTYTGNYTVTQEDINSNGEGDGLINNTATVGCDQLGPKSDYAEAPVHTAPAYIIDKVVTDVAGNGPSGYVTSAGEIVTYRINVTNAGNVDLTNVTLNDSLMNMSLIEPTGDNAPVGILNVGEIWTYTVNYTVTQEDIDNYGIPDEDIDEGVEGDIDNTATVDCDQLDPKSHSAEVPLGVPIYSIDKIITDVAGRGPAADVTAVGDVITYQINVSNIGNLDLSNITVNDSLITLTGPEGDNAPVEILDVGEIWTYTGNYTVTQEDINNTVEGKGFINNTATVNSTQLDPINDSATAPISLPIAYSIDKIVTNVAGQGPTANITAAGDVIEYQVNVINTGQVKLTNVTLNDSLIYLTGPAESLNADLILEIGEIWVYNGTYTVNQTDIDSNGEGDGFIENTATVDCDQLASKLDSAQVPIIQNPALTIEKSADPTTYSAVDQNITYTYNVTNTGNVNISAPINVTDDRLGVIPLTSGILIPGQSETVTANYTITQADLDSGAITNAAFATGVFGNNTTDSNTDNETVTAEQNPELTIEKSADPATYSAVDQNITYTYNVTNTGNVNISAPINVTDDRLGVIPLTSGILIPGQSETVTANYTITQADLDSGAITNAAFATGVFGNNTTDSNTDNETVTAEQNPELTIEKSADPATYSAVDQNITYTYNVTNTGNVNISAPINVTDDRLGVIPLTSGILIPGQSETVTANYTITQADLDSGAITNAAFATGVFGNNTTDSNTDNETVTAEQNPACTIDKIVTDVAGKGPEGNVTQAGDVISYQINVNNTGNINLTNVTVTDPLPGNLTGPAGDNPVTGVLEVGENWTFTGTYTVTQADIDSNGGGDGFINNTATVDCDQLDPKNDSEAVPITRIPDYTIDKIVTDVAGKGPEGNVTKAGDVISYQINVTNTGNSILTNVTVTDSLLGNLTDPVESINSDGILEVAETWTYSGNYTVTQTDIDSNGGGDGFIENTATVDCDQLDQKSDSESVPIGGKPGCIIDKVVTDVSGKGPEGNVTKPGDVISYQINVTNTGNVNLTNVTVADTLIENLTGPIESLNNNGILEVGETWTYSGNYTVTLQDMISNGGGDGFINNTATVDCDQLEPESDSEAVPIGQEPVEEIPGCIIDKVVTDVAGKGSEGTVTAAGEIITYQIIVTNTGNVNLTNVTVNDTLIENLNGPAESLNNDGVLEAGENWNYTGNYTVTQEDIDSNCEGDGFINNTATVDCDQLDPKSDSAEVPIGEPVQEKPDYCIYKSAVGIDEAGDCIINEPGDIIEYQIMVENGGDVDLTGVTVSDPMITLTGPAGDDTDPRVLNQGEIWKFCGNYTVTQEDIESNGQGDGFINNTATVDCDQLEPLSDSAAVPIKETPIEEEPAYIINKTIMDVAGKGPEGTAGQAGDVVSYKIQVTNAGNVNLTNVTVTDTLIQNLTGPVESRNKNGIFEVEEIWIYTGNYTVAQADIDSNGGGDGFIENTATVDCDQLDPKSASAKVPVKEPVQEKPDYCIYKSIVGIDKAGDCIINKPGDIIEYKIVVENEGNVDLTGVTVSDPMITLTSPAGDDNEPGVLNPGETWEYTGNYTVTQADINTNGGGDGFIENKATVNCNELPEESSSVKQSIILSSGNNDRNSDTHHHGSGGTGSAQVVSKPAENTQVSENTEEGADNHIQIEADTEDAKQNNGNVESDGNIESNKEKEQEGNASAPGFGVVYGIIGLLAVFLHKKKQ
jgi:uncharacterized repeat protein (TIGR01451 family)